MRATSAALLAVACTLGCGSEEAPSTSRLGEGDIAEWVLGEATTVLGAEVPFTHIVGAVRLSDGRVAVADDGTSLVHYFSDDGALLGTLGGAGDGPHEFRTIEAIGVLDGDTVWVHDFAHQRLAFIGPDQTFTRVVSLRPRLGSGRAVGVVADGTIMMGEAWSSVRVASAAEGGFSREPVAYASYSATGVFQDTVALVPGREVFLRQEGGRGVMGPAPLGRIAVHALVQDHLVVGDQDQPLLSVYGSGGALLGTLTWPGERLDVTDSLADAWRSDQIASAPPGQREAIERSLDEVELPARRPAYGRLLAGEDGEVWVAAYALPSREPASWLVLTPTGEPAARVLVPDRFAPMHVSGGLVVGVSRDELDVPRVELRSLLSVRRF